MSPLADRIGLCAFALLSLAGVGLAATWPGEGRAGAGRPDDSRGAVAVVFPPWTGAAAAAARATEAGADLVAFGRAPFIVLVRPSRDGYPRRAFGEGAMLVLDAGAIRGCAAGAKRPT